MPEYFEAFDDADQPLGLVARDEVHRTGLWHRSAHVLVWSSEGALLVQRRVDHKDLYGGKWDYSVGEHLKPGESFADGAARGLLEELGVRSPLARCGAVVRNAWCGQGCIDREIQQAFETTHDGPFTPDPAEVAEVRFLRLDVLNAWIRRSPEDFTPWFVGELTRLGVLEGG